MCQKRLVSEILHKAFSVKDQTLYLVFELEIFLHVLIIPVKRFENGFISELLALPLVILDEGQDVLLFALGDPMGSPHFLDGLENPVLAHLALNLNYIRIGGLGAPLDELQDGSIPFPPTLLRRQLGRVSFQGLPLEQKRLVLGERARFPTHALVFQVRFHILL